MFRQLIFCVTTRDTWPTAVGLLNSDSIYTCFFNNLICNPGSRYLRSQKVVDSQTTIPYLAVSDPVFFSARSFRCLTTPESRDGCSGSVWSSKDVGNIIITVWKWNGKCIGLQPEWSAAEEKPQWSFQANTHRLLRQHRLWYRRQCVRLCMAHNIQYMKSTYTQTSSLVKFLHNVA